MSSELTFSQDAHLPPGCRSADLEPSRTDAIANAHLWHLLDDEIRSGLYREFFHDQWPELADLLDEHEESMNRLHNSAGLGQTIRLRWRHWREAALNRLADGGHTLPPL